MKFFTTTVILGALSSLVAATPAALPQGFGGFGQRNGPSPSFPTNAPSQVTNFPRPTYTAPVCLTNATATKMVNDFASLLTNYKKSVAEALLASDFTDTSDSINFLGGYPLGSVTFPSKAAFEAGQGSQPAIGFTVDSIDAIACTSLAFRWTAHVGGPDPVKGIDIFIASNLNGTDAGWQIKTVFSEFNSAAWAIDIGGSCKP